jgi:hypothetical protein
MPTLFARGVVRASVVALAAVASFAQTPSIHSITPSATRSGFILVGGANFGTSGELLVDGLSAPVASWTATEIAAYVPELARLGTVSAVVNTAAGASNAATIAVTDRQPSGRLRWRFRMDAPYSMVRPVRAADGTVYAIDVYHRLYALSPTGALKWLVRNAGNKGLALAPDGTVYTGSENDVKAFTPEGVLKWTFVQNPRAFILLGLTADTSGHVYGVASSGMGAFSLNLAGQERWRTPEAYNRPNVTYSELAIGPAGSSDHLYWYGNAHTRAVRTHDGSSVATFGGGQPVVSPFDGTVHIGSSAYTPNGQLLWSHTTGYGASIPDVARDGTHYYVSGSTNLFALNTSGSPKWNLQLPKYVGSPDVDPTHSVVVLTGSGTLNIPGFAQGVSTAARKVNWELPFPVEEPTVYNPATGQYGFNQFADTRARFTADGTTAYLGTAIAPGGVPIRNRCFLNAIDTSLEATPVEYKMRVDSIKLTATTTGYVLVTAAIKVVDAAGVPVPYATVSGTWRAPSGVLKPSATTDGNGMVYFTYGYTRGTYTFTVNSVTKAGYTFDAAGSVLKQSITV